MVNESKPSPPAGFREFITRGNVIDQPVAVVVGAAFITIVNSVVNGVINPHIGAFGTKDLVGYSSCLKGPCQINGKGETLSGIRVQRG